MTLTGAHAEAATPRLTRVIKEVQLETLQAAPRGAAQGDVLRGGAVVRTGREARAEISFANRAVTRLGGKTILKLHEGRMNLQEGAVLFQAPGDAAAKIRSGGVTIGASGVTGLVERFGKAYIKVLVLEGTARVYVESRVGESVLVEAGQMLIMKPNPKVLPEAVHFDIEQLSRTSLLMNPDFAPLASRASIAREIEKQKSDPDFIRTNLVIFGRGTLVNLVEPAPTRPPMSPPKPNPR